MFKLGSNNTCLCFVRGPGRKLFFQFLRIQYTLSGAPKVGYAQLRCIFRAKLGATSKVVFLVRWAEVLPKRDWDSTGQPLLRWTQASAEKKLGNSPGLYQFIDIDTVLETVTVLPKPKIPASVDIGCIHDADRQMWVHTVGSSALGET